MKLKKHFINSFEVIQAMGAPTAISNTNQNTVNIYEKTAQDDISKRIELSKVRISKLDITTLQQTLKNPIELKQILAKNEFTDEDRQRNRQILNIINNIDLSKTKININAIKLKVLSHPIFIDDRYGTLDNKKRERHVSDNKPKYKIPTQVNTEKQWYVNNDVEIKDLQTSKLLHIMLQKTYDTLKHKEDLTKNLKETQEIIKNIDIAIVALATATVISSFAAIFFWPFAGLSLAISAVILGLKLGKDYFINKNNSTKQALGALESIKNTSLLNHAPDVAQGVLNGVLFGNDLLKSIGLVHLEISKTTTKYLSLVSFIYDAQSLSNSIYSLLETDKELSNIYRDISNIQNLQNQNKKEWAEFKKLNKIVVISESLQNKSYKDGGTGGTNKLFKRLIDGKIFTRKEMLEMSKYKLDMYNLIKVKRTVTKNNKTHTYEYIRSKYSNKTLKDNLG